MSGVSTTATRPSDQQAGATSFDQGPGKCVALITGVRADDDAFWAEMDQLALLAVSFTPGRDPHTIALWWGNPPVVVFTDVPPASWEQVEGDLERLREWVRTDVSPARLVESPEQVRCRGRGDPTAE